MKVRTRKVLSLDCSVVAQLNRELPEGAQNAREGRDVRKTQIGGSSTRFPKAWKNKVFSRLGIVPAMLLLLVVGCYYYSRTWSRWRT